MLIEIDLNTAGDIVWLCFALFAGGWAWSLGKGCGQLFMWSIRNRNEIIKAVEEERRNDTP